MENLSSDLVYVGVKSHLPYSIRTGICYLPGSPIGFDQKVGNYFLFPLPEENKPIECVELTPEKVLEVGFKFEERPAREYTGPKEWEPIIRGVQNPAPYTFENLIARAHSWTDEWLWARNPVSYIPSSVGFFLSTELVRYLQYSLTYFAGLDFFKNLSEKRTLEDVFGDVQVSYLEDGTSQPGYLLGFAPLESLENFERRSFQHLFTLADKFLAGAVAKAGELNDNLFQRGIMRSFASDVVAGLSYFSDTPQKDEQVRLREVLLEYLGEHSPVSSVTALERLQKRMHKRLPCSQIFQNVQNLVRAKDELEERLKDPSYFKK